MNNVFRFKEFSIGLRYDLKGSSQGRTELDKNTTIQEYSASKIKTALKDNDWRKYVK